MSTNIRWVLTHGSGRGRKLRVESRIINIDDLVKSKIY